MKYILLIVLVGLLLSPAFGQDDELPSNVDHAFKAKYPKAKSVYGYPEENIYKIDFEISNKNYTAIYAEDGTWIETSSLIPDDEVPAKVVSAINKAYQDIEISFSELVEHPKEGKFFRINCYTDDADYVINVTSEGTILHSEKKINTYDFEG